MNNQIGIGNDIEITKISIDYTYHWQDNIVSLATFMVYGDCFNDGLISLPEGWRLFESNGLGGI